jgi:hypothetical protein
MRHFAKKDLRITHYLEDKHPGQGTGKAWNGDFADVFCGWRLQWLFCQAVRLRSAQPHKALDNSANRTSRRELPAFHVHLPKLKVINTRKKNADGRVVFNRG